MYIVSKKTQDGRLIPVDDIPASVEWFHAFRHIFERNMYAHKQGSSINNQMTWLYMTGQLSQWKKYWIEHPEANVLQLYIYQQQEILTGQMALI